MQKEEKLCFEGDIMTQNGIQHINTCQNKKNNNKDIKYETKEEIKKNLDNKEIITKTNQIIGLLVLIVILLVALLLKNKKNWQLSQFLKYILC